MKNLCKSEKKVEEMLKLEIKDFRPILTQPSLTPNK